MTLVSENTKGDLNNIARALEELDEEDEDKGAEDGDGDGKTYLVIKFICCYQVIN